MQSGRIPAFDYLTPIEFKQQYEFINQGAVLK